MFKVHQSFRIDKDGNKAPYFFAKFKDGKGWSKKTIPVEIQNEEAANQWMRDFLSPKAGNVSPTIRRLSPGWLEHAKKKCDPRYYQQHASNFKNHILTCKLADMPISDVQPMECAEWISSMKMAPYTVRNVVKTLRAFFDDIIFLRQFSGANPFLNRNVQKSLPEGIRRAGKNTFIHLTKDVALALVKCRIPSALRRTRNIAGIATGARDSELQGLKFKDLNLNARIPTLRIERQLVDTWSVSPKFKKPKSDSERTIPLHPLALEALSAWKDQGWEEHTGRKPTDDDAVFPSANGGHVRFRSAQYLREDLALAKQPILYDGKYKYDAHCMRRTFATHLKNAGVDKSQIKILLGHAGSDCTDRHYISADIAPAYQAVLKLPLPRSLRTVLRSA